MICGGAGSCIEAIHGAVKWAVERGLVEGAAEWAVDSGLVVGVVKLASGWLIPTSQL
jgi:hypothetical protein